MYWIQVFMIASGLAMDAFAVSLGAAAAGRARGGRAAFRLSFHFGLFQFMMPVIGWYLALRIEMLITPIDHWIAFVLLSIVGGRMILAGIRTESESFRSDPSRGMSLLALSVATSIDALAVGLTLAFLQTQIWWPSIIIGIVTCAFSLVGILLGTSLGIRFGKRMEIAGGIILILIGARILISHLTS